MRRIFLTMICLASLAVNASTFNYLCAITEISVDTLASTQKNQYTLNWTQKCKNTAEYDSKPEGTYTTTVKLVINSDDRTLEGTYTTAGADPNSSSANVNDQTINLVTSELYYGSTRRLLRSDSVSTFTIIKIDDSHYAISEGRLCFTAAALADRGKNTYSYNYCYAEEDILQQGIEPTPFIFKYTGEFEEVHTHYDMTVKSVFVERDDNVYGSTRYFLTLSCTGKNRTTQNERNYEVQLEILPDEESIAGTFATNTGQPLFAMNSYVKDLKINKTRYLTKDSTNIIEIMDNGNKTYRLFGGTLICTDIDANYLAVHDIKRVTEAHYYHFSESGVEFGYDEESTSTELDISSVVAEPILDGFRLTVQANAGSMNFEVNIELESEQLAGTFTVDNGLSLWSTVTRGGNNTYISEGATVTINAKNSNTFTLSGNLLCENEHTYVLKAFDFHYGEPTGVELLESEKSRVESKKILREGVMLIKQGEKTFTMDGAAL